jgi:membrane protein involved in D-alanine export
MSGFISLLFYGFLASFGAGYRAVNTRVALRPYALILISLVFLRLFIIQDVTQMVIMLAYSMAVIGIAVAVSNIWRAKAWVYSTSLVAVVAALIASKYKSTLFGATDPSSIFDILAISYITFRAISMITFCHNTRAIQSVPNMLAYLLFFSPYQAGPIIRFSTFAEDMRNPAPKLASEDWLNILGRIALGLVKILVLSKIALYRTPQYMIGETSGVLDVMLSLNARLLFYYFDFSGYCDIAIAIGRVFGVRVPENFSMPFISRNIQDFWTRWHITAANFFRDFVFFPSYKKLILSGVNANLTKALCLFLTLFLMGVWHGNSLNWAFYGLYHGLAMVCFFGFDHGLEVFAPDLRLKMRNSMAARVVSTVFTLQFVAFGMIFTIDESSFTMVTAALKHALTIAG